MCSNSDEWPKLSVVVMAEVGVGLGCDMIKIAVNILSNDANNIIYSEGWWLIGRRSCEGGGSWCCSSGKN